MRNDALGAVSELAAAQHGVFSRRQAAQHGCTKAHLRRLLDDGLITEPRSGVLVIAGAPPTWRQKLSERVVTPGVVISHRAAARLHRLDGFAQHDPVEVTSSRPLRLAETIVHRRTLPSSDVVLVDRIPVTSVARTLTDLGDVVSADLVERALDDARRRGLSLLWLRRTAERLRRPGVAGPKALLQLLDQLDPDQRVRDSWFERLIEQALTDSSLPPIERQFTLHAPDGTFVARFDLAMPSIKLGIEAHSREFHFGRNAEHRDEDRDHRIAACGWDTVYLGWSSAQHPHQALEIVRSIVAARSRASGQHMAPGMHHFGA